MPSLRYKPLFKRLNVMKSILIIHISVCVCVCMRSIGLTFALFASTYFVYFDALIVLREQ